MSRRDHCEGEEVGQLKPCPKERPLILKFGQNMAAPGANPFDALCDGNLILSLYSKHCASWDRAPLVSCLCERKCLHCLMHTKLPHRIIFEYVAYNRQCRYIVGVLVVSSFSASRVDIDHSEQVISVFTPLPQSVYQSGAEECLFAGGRPFHYNTRCHQEISGYHLYPRIDCDPPVSRL